MTINCVQVQPPTKSPIMQRYRSSILFGNKQVFDQQRELAKGAIIAAQKRESRPQNECLWFLAKLAS